MGNCIGYRLEELRIHLTPEPQYGTYHSHDIYKSDKKLNKKIGTLSDKANSI